MTFKDSVDQSAKRRTVKYENSDITFRFMLDDQITLRRNTAIAIHLA